MAGGMHHHQTNLDKYHPGYFGKVSALGWAGLATAAAPVLTAWQGRHEVLPQAAEPLLEADHQPRQGQTATLPTSELPSA